VIIGESTTGEMRVTSTGHARITAGSHRPV